jgi:hypothetical protein
MGTLGIITCEILEREFSWLLARDTDVQKVTVLENKRSAGLIEQLELLGTRDVQRIPHPRSFVREGSEKLEVIVQVLETGLHRNCHVLKRKVNEAARELSFHVDALFLGYGACGNALVDHRDWLDVNIPIFRPMHAGRPVDDCVGLFLGGKEGYYAQQCQAPGTFFLTPGWASHWKQIFEKGTDNKKYLDILKKMFVRYTRFLLVLTPVMDRNEMKSRAKEFQQMVGLDIEECQGTLDIFLEAWESSKAYLESISEGYAWKQ